MLRIRYISILSIQAVDNRYGFFISTGNTSFQGQFLWNWLVRAISLQVSRPSHSWDTAILIFHLENPRSRSWARSKFKVTTWVQHSIDSHPFRSMSIDPSITETHKFINLTLKIQGDGEIRVMLHNYRSRQFHINLNGINPSRDMASTKSGSSTASFDQFWAMCKPIWGNGQITMTVHNYKSKQVNKT